MARTFVSSLLKLLVLTTLAAVGFPQTTPDWTEPFPPHRVIGNVYYVGSRGLASYLITTPQGHILINTNFEETVPFMKKNIESLGFKLTDIKIITASHEHADHVTADYTMKQLTGSRNRPVPSTKNGRRSR